MEEALRIQLFATARRAVGRPALDWPLPAEGTTVRELLSALRAQYPRLSPTLRASRFLRNDVYLTDLETRLRPGDTFSVHPPYGGG